MVSVVESMQEELTAQKENLRTVDFFCVLHQIPIMVKNKIVPYNVNVACMKPHGKKAKGGVMRCSFGSPAS